DAAAILNVGKRSVERARVVVETGILELVDAVEQGRVSVSEAAKMAKKGLSHAKKVLKRAGKIAKPSAKRLNLKSAEKEIRKEEIAKAAASAKAEPTRR